MKRLSIATSVGLLLLTGCGSSGPLRDPADPNRLLDGEVRMTTRRSSAPEAVPDVRLVACVDGKIAVSYDGRDGRLEGEASVADWERLWKRLEPVAPWGAQTTSVELDDPEGGPYHVTTLRLGGRSKSFSAQLQGGIVQFGTKNGVRRMEYANTVVDFVGSFATKRTRSGPAAPASRPASVPATPPTGR